MRSFGRALLASVLNESLLYPYRVLLFSRASLQTVRWSKAPNRMPCLAIQETALTHFGSKICDFEIHDLLGHPFLFRGAKLTGRYSRQILHLLLSEASFGSTVPGWSGEGARS